MHYKALAGFLYLGVAGCDAWTTDGIQPFYRLRSQSPRGRKTVHWTSPQTLWLPPESPQTPAFCAGVSATLPPLLGWGLTTEMLSECGPLGMPPCHSLWQFRTLSEVPQTRAFPNTVGI